MENASKALIIAGAILLSILIITLGIMIYRQAAGVVNNNAMDEAEVAAFNSKFTQYCGNNVRGSTVNALAEAVISNNRVADNNGENNKLIDLQPSGTNSISFYFIKCTVDGDNNWHATTRINVKAKTGDIYNVSVGEYNNSGFIKSIKCEKQN